MKRITALLILAAVSFGLFACTGGATDGSGGTASSDVTSSEITSASDIYYEPDSLPDLNFGGTKVNICVRSDHYSELYTDELSSEPVSDSIYNRERYVEDRLGVEIEIVVGSASDMLVKQFTADEDSYQIFADHTYNLSATIFQGYLLDAMEIDYLDFSKPWWPKDFIDAVSLEDKVFILSGPLSLSRTRYTFATYFNKKLADDYSFSDPRFGELYDIVERGEWTIDLVTEMTSGLYEDLNGNSERDEEDRYGIGFQTEIGLDPVWSGFGIAVLERTDDGWFSLNTQTERMFDGLEKFRYLLHDNGGTYLTPGNDDLTLFTQLAKAFSNDQIIFMVNKFEAAERPTLRNMSSDYGLLPFPKYDKEQKDYISHSHDNQMAFGIPATNRDPDTSGAVLEAMASYSYRETMPLYLDFALKGKYMSDAKARKTVDIVVSHLSYDPYWAYVYTLGSGFMGPYRTALRQNDASFASIYAQKASSVKRSLTAYRLTFNSLFGN